MRGWAEKCWGRVILICDHWKNEEDEETQTGTGNENLVMSVSNEKEIVADVVVSFGAGGSSRSGIYHHDEDTSVYWMVGETKFQKMLRVQHDRMWWERVTTSHHHYNHRSHPKLNKKLSQSVFVTHHIHYYHLLWIFYTSIILNTLVTNKRRQEEQQ